MSEERVYEAALRGIASCTTECPCCRMHKHIAEHALGINGDAMRDRIEREVEAAVVDAEIANRRTFLKPLTAVERQYTEDVARAYYTAQFTGIPALLTVGSVPYGHRTSEKGRDAQGPGQAGELAHYPV